MKQQLRKSATAVPSVKSLPVQKDAVIKSFIENDDVFADVANYVLFDGKQVIRKDRLESVHPVSLNYKENGVTWLARDISKIWKEEAMIICMIGCENQTVIDPSMLFRTLMYDASSYVSQIQKGYRVRHIRY